MRWSGPSFHGKASVIWRAIQSAVGLAVTLRDISRRRLVPENDQHEEQLEAACRHDQEVHGGDAGRMIAEESLPGLRRPSPTLAIYLATVD